VVKLTHLGSNSRFDMSVVFTANYSFSGDDVPIDSDALLVTDFVNLRSSRLSLSEVLIDVGCTSVCL
jgi:hypothetical protein